MAWEIIGYIGAGLLIYLLYRLGRALWKLWKKRHVFVALYKLNKNNPQQMLKSAEMLKGAFKFRK